MSTAPPVQPKKSFLASLKTHHAKPQVTIFHGEPGIGKTECLANFPNAVWGIDDLETGIFDLKNAGTAPPELPVAELNNYQETMEFLEELRVGEHSYQYLVMETLNGLERFLHEYCRDVDYEGIWNKKGFMGFQEGYKTSTQYVRNYIRALDRLRNERGMAIVLSCHSERRTWKNATGPDYDKMVPALHDKTWELFSRWSSTVLFMHKKIELVESNKRQHGVQEIRVIATEGSASWEAKNRWRLPAEIQMGNSGEDCFASLVKAKKDARKNV